MASSQEERMEATTQPKSAQTGQEPPLTEDEKKFLKESFVSEFRFLTQHGLSIYKEEDRQVGRAILRALMAHEGDEDAGEEAAEDEYDFERHLADHYFTEEQLEFIEKGYGSSMAFMHSFGLKFYDDDDCREAVAIVEAFMADDD